MGHLFSRAFKRLTQGSSNSSSSQSSTRNGGSKEHGDRTGAEIEENQDTYHIAHNGRPLAQSIPVGQSIDSAEYTALKINNHKDKQYHSKKEADAETNAVAAAVERQLELGQEDEKQTITNNEDGTACKGPGVEEAVIKIQALVRGHLTRKALKDSRHHSVPPPNALGQFQFDEESLIKNPLSAVFLTPSPLSLERVAKQQQPITTHIAEQTPSRTPLDSIAESTETTTAPPAIAPTNVQPASSTEAVIVPTPETQAAGTQITHEQRNNEERRKLAKLNTRSSTSSSKLETPSQLSLPHTPDSCSPVPSEANVSIDLNTCGTPASASIDILDHSIRPTDKISSVLYPIVIDEKSPRSEEIPAREQVPRTLNDVVVDVGGENEQQEQKPLACSSTETPENEEAAAIRIQSAFRGYRTRKNSPYRTRSPTTSSANKHQQDAQFNQQEQSTIHDESEEFCFQSGSIANEDSQEKAIKHELAVEDENIAHLENAGAHSRRSSRPRHKDCEVAAEKLGSLDEFTITDEADTTTVKESLPIQQQQHHLDRLSDTTIESAEGPAKKSLLTTKTLQADYSNNNNGNNSDQTTTTTATSLSLDRTDLTDVNVSELDTTEAPVTSTGNVTSAAALETTQYAGGMRSSFTRKSDATSLETLDTDSSFLGAALSLNEDESMTEEIAQTTTTVSPDQAANAAELIQQAIDEDKSLITNGLKSEALKLVDDDTTKSSTHLQQYPSIEDSTADQGGALVEEADGLDERAAAKIEEQQERRADQQLEQDDIWGKERTATAQEDEIEQLLASVTLSEEEQRAIELESDEIERRDPRGQASEERVKSPEIITEQPQFGDVSTGSVLEARAEDGLETEKLEKQPPVKQQQQEVLFTNTNVKHATDINGSSSHNLTVETPTQQYEGADSANVSGRSSPAFNSSNAPSSSEPDDDDDEDAGEGEQKQAQQSASPSKRQTELQQSGGRNKKRNNRNKRKNKK